MSDSYATLPITATVKQRSTALYRHFDRNGRLLYVGISLSAVYRLSQHHQKSAWHDDIVRIEVQHFKDRKYALKAEALAIKKERPIYNKTMRFRHSPELMPALKCDLPLPVSATFDGFSKIAGIDRELILELIRDGIIKTVMVDRLKLIVMSSYVDFLSGKRRV